MTEFSLWLESGPRRRKTMAHVLDLLGCVANGPTTEDAVAAAPDAIRSYLAFLARHGEPADPAAAFDTTVAEHVTTGVWLGYGDPTPGFARDFEPLDADELAIHVRRLTWLGGDLLALIDGLPAEALIAEPEGAGRPIYHILEHVVGSQATYLRYLTGPVDGLSEAAAMARGGPESIRAALADVWEISVARLAALTDAQRVALVPHGQVTWTARRALRRMLEHGWEHHQEIARRFGPSR